MIIYEPGFGEDISTSCQEAVLLARISPRRETVKFTFNDIELRAKVGVSAKQLEKQWHRLTKEAGERWRKSEAGVRYYAEQKQRHLERQSAVDRLIPQLEKASHSLQNYRPILIWLREFGDVAGFIGIQYDKQFVIDTLENAGFTDGAWVGQLPEWFDRQERMAQYIVGQFLNGLKTRGCWPDILLHSCDKALAMPK